MAKSSSRKAALRKKRKPADAPAKLGRPPVEITKAQWKMIERMATAQCTVQEMADRLGISRRTFHAPHLKEEFERITRMKAAESKFKVREHQLAMALKGNQAWGPIWWGKNNLGQADKAEVAGKEGGPLEIIHGAEARLMSVLARLSKGVAPE